MGHYGSMSKIGETSLLMRKHERIIFLLVCSIHNVADCGCVTFEFSVLFYNGKTNSPDIFSRF